MFSKEVPEIPTAFIFGADLLIHRPWQKKHGDFGGIKKEENKRGAYLSHNLQYGLRHIFYDNFSKEAMASVAVT
jgi:hypothetical protein